MPFCPECKIEYRAGIKSCSDCGVDLVAELAEETNVHDDSDTDFVKFRSFDTSAEAEFACDLLERNGVRAFVEGGRFAVVAGFSGEVVVMVDERDIVRAVELYSAYFESEPQQPAPSDEDQNENQ